MKRTSSPSAKDTARMEQELVINGTQPIDPLFVSTYEEMLAYRGAEKPKVSDRRFFFWELWGRIKHLTGLHTFVPMEEWDIERGTFRYIGLSCWHCPEQRR